ncbi:hypothetical protein ACFLZ7_01045 [Nanoarchaeota archaeon]
MISYKTIQKNTRLTDFEDIKEAVIEHRAKTKHVPKFKKKEGDNKSLNLFV